MTDSSSCCFLIFKRVDCDDDDGDSCVVDADAQLPVKDSERQRSSRADSQVSVWFAWWTA